MNMSTCISFQSNIMACWKKLCQKYQTENSIAIVECCNQELIEPVKLTKNIYADKKDSIDFAKLDLFKIGESYDLGDDHMTDRRRGYRIALASLLFYTKNKRK